MIGDDGERLERRLGKLARIPGQDIVPHLVVVGGVGIQPPAPRDLSELETAVRRLVLGGKLGQGLGHLAGRGARRAGELGGGHGVVGNKEQRLEQRLQLVGFKGLEFLHLYSSPTVCSLDSEPSVDKSSAEDASMTRSLVASSRSANAVASIL